MQVHTELVIDDPLGHAIHSVHSSIRRQDIRLKVDRQPFED